MRTNDLRPYEFVKYLLDDLLTQDSVHMRLSAQPARKSGSPKCIYSAPLRIEDVQIDENGDVTVSIVADDIYSKHSKQRYQITLTEAEISILSRGAEQRLRA